ncbi:porin [Photobacterium kishitanii]|uniref:Porin domain-containing protein n=1 Tax=Photobacterium kishitanii TaxID=318456 RepID=A0A2T3KMB5_9GAMM|nr:porin [Photobacterium kishitanii]PSV00924.1 hypothetical protein C9J27_02535 [Photobacterium kishitanii]
MKKSILVAAMALATFGANAAPTTAVDLSAPQLYGKVGVSVDHVNETTVMDYLSNTEVGVHGTAGVPHNIKASYDVKGEFNAKDQFELSKLDIGLDYDMFSAHFGKIDSRYSKVTTDFDVFDNVFSGTTFDRDYVPVTGLAVSANPITDLEVGIQVSGQESSVELGHNIALYSNYSINNLDLSAGYEFEAKDIDNGRATDAHGFSLAAGYTLGDISASTYFISHKVDGVKADNTFGIQSAYQLTDTVALKAGYEHAKTGVTKAKTNTYRVAAQYDLTDALEFNAGYGNVKTTGHSSDDLLTVGAVYKF